MRDAAFWIAALLAASCSGSPGDASPSGQDTASATAPGSAASPVQRTVARGRDGLSLVDHTVYGLMIPRGMQPAPSPDKVYRFTGFYPVEQVLNYMGRQTIGAKRVQEEDGYLLRNANVRYGNSRAEVALRIFKGKASGATLDIWLEKQYPDQIPDRRAPDSPGGIQSSYTTRGKPQVPHLVWQPGQLRSGARTTLRVLTKLQTGKPVSQQELDNANLD